MASIGFMVGSALVNALAFTGGNFIFSLANKHGSMDKVKRHNKAMEELSKKRDEWTKQQRELLKREQKSVGDFKDISYAAELYHTMTEEQEQQVEQGQKVQRVGVVGEPEPQLSDYYQPSEEQRIYEYLFIVLGMGASFNASSFFHTSK